MASSIFIWPGLFSTTGSSVTFLVPAYLQDGTAAAPSLAFASHTNYGLYLRSNTNLDFVLNGTPSFDIQGGTIALRSGQSFGWSATDDASGAQDTLLARDAANTLALKNGTNLQTFRVYDVSGTGYTAYGGSGISTYKNVATAGWGSPAIYASGRSTAQTAAVASVANYTVGAADGTFEVSANVDITAFVGGTFTVTCAYTDEGNTARTLTLNLTNTAGAIATACAVVGPFASFPTTIRCKSATAITIATAGTFTSLTYNVSGLIKQVA